MLYIASNVLVVANSRSS